MTSGLMTFLDTSFSNSVVNVSDVIKYYTFYANQFFSSTNKMMDEMKGKADAHFLDDIDTFVLDMDMEALITNSSLHTLMAEGSEMMPDLMQALKKTLMDPENVGAIKKVNKTKLTIVYS
jgi:hypothetical protein